MSCNKSRAFLVENLFNELKTDGEKRIARLNLGVKDSDSLTWGNVHGNIYDQLDLLELIEMVKNVASLTGTVIIFRLNDQTIDRTIDDIPEGWTTDLPDTTLEDALYMALASKLGGIYKVGDDGNIWSQPIQINYYNVVTAAQLALIDELIARLNEAIEHQEYVDELINNMNLVTVNADGSIVVTGRDGEASVWQHQDLGNYLLLGNAYGNDEAYFVLNKSGLLRAYNAVIYGTIYATDGWFAGELRAATGSFKGEVKATSGTIGGWRIVDGVLLPENIPTTAIVGKIQASLVDFGTTLIDLRDLIQSDYDLKFTNLQDIWLNNVDLLSSRFTVTTDSIKSLVSSLKAVLNELSDKLAATNSNTYKQLQLLESKINLTAEELTLGVSNTLMTYSDKFNDYVTTSQFNSTILALTRSLSLTVSETLYNLDKEEILNRIAHINITPELISSAVNDLLNGQLTEIEQTVEGIEASVSANDTLLASLGISAEGIQMRGKTLSYSATNDTEHPIFICNEDGSGQLSKGKIAWNTHGELTVRGAINAESGAIGGWEITDTYIQGSLYISNYNTTTNMFDVIKSNTKLYNNGCIEINSISGYATQESNEYQATVGIIYNVFAGLNEDGLYTATDSFTPESHYTTIRQYTNLIKVDGSGLLANDNINWDTRGNITIKFTLSNNGVDYDITLDNEGIHYVNTEDDSRRGTLTWVALIDNVS